jgi:sn-glycerol 3-phosphate transport system permease protein
MDTPFLLILISAVLGAGFLAYTMRQYHIGIRLSAGALAGVVGMLFFMFPLNFCTFEPERKTADFILGIILIAVGMALSLFATRYLLGLFANRDDSPIESDYPPGAFRSNFLVPLILLAPTLIILALFLYYPAIDTFRLSTLLTRLGISRTAFVCVDNFTRLVSDSNYLDSLGVTVFMSIAIVVLGQSLGLLIATMAYQPVKGAKIYRALLIWPYSISPVVAGMIFLLLFNPTGGIINHFLFNVVGTRIPWLNDPLFAPWTVILASVWKSLGFNILFYIAGLQNVPNDLKEAAAIDGANAFQRFFRIVVPMLSPISFFLMITNTTYAIFDTFGTIDYLTGGGPLKSTTTLMYNVYQVGIQNNDLGKAAAQSIILFVMVIGLTLIQFRTAGRQVNYGA